MISPFTVTLQHVNNDDSITTASFNPTKSQTWVDIATYYDNKSLEINNASTTITVTKEFILALAKVIKNH